MTTLSTFLLVFHFWINYSSQNLLTCRSTKSQTNSGTGDDDYTQSWCDSDELILGCGVLTVGRGDNDVDGAEPRGDPNKGGSSSDSGYCHAQNGNGGSGVKSYSSCCKINGGSSNNALDCYISKAGGYSTQSYASCNAGYVVTACGVLGPWMGIIHATYDYGENRCEAEGFGDVKANAICCKAQTGYELDCETVFDPMNEVTGGDSESCNNGKTLTGCSFRVEADQLNRWSFINGWYTSYTSGNGFCHSRSLSGKGITSFARCCSVTEASSGWIILSDLWSTGKIHALAFASVVLSLVIIGLFCNYKILKGKNAKKKCLNVENVML